MRRLFFTLTDPDWLYRHRAKFAGFAFGSAGSWIIALFLTVAITGVPVGADPRPVEQVYFPEQ